MLDGHSSDYFVPRTGGSIDGNLVINGDITASKYHGIGPKNVCSWSASFAQNIGSANGSPVYCPPGQYVAGIKCEDEGGWDDACDSIFVYCCDF